MGACWGGSSGVFGVEAGGFADHAVEDGGVGVFDDFEAFEAEEDGVDGAVVEDAGSGRGVGDFEAVFGGEAWAFEEVPEELPEADLVVGDAVGVDLGARGTLPGVRREKRSSGGWPSA